jgi:hypothetical protein
MRHLLLVAMVVAGCSENPLDPDKKGCILTAAGEICASDDVPGGPGGGGPGGDGETCDVGEPQFVPDCDVACTKVRCCAPEVDGNECQQVCEAQWNDEIRTNLIRATCEQVRQALQGG